MVQINNKAIVFIVLFVIAQVILYLYLASNASTMFHSYRTTNSDNSKIWIEAPRLSLFVRVFHGDALKLMNVFLLSSQLFWPSQNWPTSDVVVVWDDESLKDHHMATMVSGVSPFPVSKFEAPPNDTFLCDDWRSLGYARQQWSTFYADNYTDAEWIGIVDSDTAFITPVVPDDLFEKSQDGSKIRARVIGYNGCCTGLLDSVAEALGHEAKAEFMVVAGFPFIVKRSHFAQVRKYITEQMEADSFEHAFQKICSKYKHRYSQIDLIGNYLYLFARDDYAWHIKNGPLSKHTSVIDYNQTEDSEIGKYNIPKVSVMKHMPFRDANDVTVYYLLTTYLCVASNWTAGSCEMYKREDVEKSIHDHLGVDWQWDVEGWDELEWPKENATMITQDHLFKGKMYEKPWEAPGYPTWKETIENRNEHIRHKYYGDLKRIWKPARKQ